MYKHTYTQEQNIPEQRILDAVDGNNLKVLKQGWDIPGVGRTVGKALEFCHEDLHDLFELCDCVSAFVCVCVCVCVCDLRVLSVCVCVREREREREFV